MYKMIKSEKFHHMNATVETVRFDGDMVVERLVSYESVVCDVCKDTGNIFIYPRYQYSPTTVRQFTRFLNENVPLENERWYIGLVRELRAKADSGGYVRFGKYGIFFLDHVLGTSRRW